MSPLKVAEQVGAGGPEAGSVRVLPAVVVEDVGVAAVRDVAVPRLLAAEPVDYLLVAQERHLGVVSVLLSKLPLGWWRLASWIWPSRAVLESCRKRRGKLRCGVLLFQMDVWRPFRKS